MKFSRFNPLRQLMIGLLGLSIAGVIYSQTEGTPPPAVPPLPPGVPAPAPDSGAPAPASDPAAAPKLVKERTVFVPFEDLAKSLADEGQGAFLPYREFLQLWNELNLQKAKEQEKSPADAVLSSVEYTGKVTGEVVEIAAVLKAESFKNEGWAVLSLVGAGLNVAQAETGEASLRLGEHGYELLLPKKGKYEVKLKILARVERNSGRFLVKLALPKAPVSRCTLTIPEEGWEFRLQPVAAHTVRPNNGASELAFFFGEAENIEISWQKVGGESKLTPLIFAEMAQKVTATPGSLHNSLSVSYRILRASVDKFSLTIPQPHEVLRVEGENIKEWNVQPGEGGAPQELVVTLHGPARDAYQLGVELETGIDALPAEQKIPQIEAKDVVRQRGTLSIRAAAELDAVVKDLAGLHQQEVSTPAPAPNQGAAAPATDAEISSYRYLKLPFTAGLALKRAEPVVEVTSSCVLKVGLDTVRFTAAFWGEVKRSGIFDMRVQLPTDFDSIEATGASVDSFKLEESDGQRFLDVRFKSKVSGPFAFEVSGRRVRENAEQPVTVPVFSPQNVSRHEALVGVAMHESLDPNTKELGGLRQEDVASILPQLPGYAPAQTIQQQQEAAPPPALSPLDRGIGTPTLAFRYRGEAAPAVIQLKLKQSQVIGDVLTWVELKEQAVRYHWNIVYDVQYAGVDSFLISVPKAIAKDLRVETKDLKEVDKNFTKPAAAAAPDAPAPEDGKSEKEAAAPAPAERDLWKISLRDKRMGAFSLALSLEVPNKELGPGQTTDLVVPELILEDVFQEIGQTAVTKDGNLEILESTPEAMESIDPKELRTPLARPGVILAYKSLKHPSSLKLKISKNAYLEVPQAVVTYAVLNASVSQDGASSTEVIYWVKNNSQQFFSVELPPRGKMTTDVYVNGEPQQPMKRADKNDLLIRLPGGQVGAEFPVRFVYSVPALPEQEGKDMGLNGSVTVEVPKLDAAILQSQLTLYLPQDYVYTDFQGPMRRRLQDAGWSDPHRRLRWLIPALGPDLVGTQDKNWTAPPSLSPQTTGGLNVSLATDGKKFQLHRLDAPKATTVSYRAAKFDLALRSGAILVALLIGVMLTRCSVETKAVYFCLVGLGSLVLRGLTEQGWAPLWESIWLGVLGALGVWILVGFLRLITPKPLQRVSGGASGPAPSGSSGGTPPFGSPTGGESPPVSGRVRIRSTATPDVNPAPTESKAEPASRLIPVVLPENFPVGASAPNPTSTTPPVTPVAITPPTGVAGETPLPVDPSQILFRESGESPPSAGEPEKPWYERVAIAHSESAAAPPAAASAEESLPPFPEAAPPESPKANS